MAGSRGQIVADGGSSQIAWQHDLAATGYGVYLGVGLYGPFVGRTVFGHDNLPAQPFQQGGLAGEFLHQRETTMVVGGNEYGDFLLHCREDTLFNGN